MKRIFLIIITFFSFINITNATPESCGKEYSALVFNEKTKEILFQKTPDKIIYPASLVKLMTLYLTFEAIELGKISPEDKMIASPKAVEISQVNKITTLNLKVGDVLTIREAIRGLIVKSMNELTVMLSEKISFSEWDFVKKMNQKAFELGMFNTSFKNASGLHEEGQYSSNYDLARLAMALKNDFPEYYHLFSLKEFVYNNKKYDSHNHVLVSYEGAEGMKTGFTSIAGFNLISVAKRENERVMAVLTSCESYKSRDKLMKQLLDFGFDQIKNKKSDDFAIKLQDIFNYKANSQKEVKDYKSEARLEMAIN